MPDSGHWDVEILKWEKYNARADVKEAAWFRLNHQLFEHPDFLCFTKAQDFTGWIYLLSLASKRGSGKIQVFFDHARRVAFLSPKDLQATIRKLEGTGHILVTAAYGTHTAADDRTRPDDVQKLHLDLEALYKKYPRQVGKQKGLEKAKAEIHTQADYDSLSRAIDRYTAYCRKQKTEAKYIKHFSTFMTTWRDWLDEDAGRSSLNGSGQLVIGAPTVDADAITRRRLRELGGSNGAA